MGPVNLIRAPWRAANAVVQAAHDLHTLAERARRDADRVEDVHALLESLVVGGRHLRLSGESLDAHTVELISGGRELTENAKEIAADLAVLRAALPRIVEGLDAVDEIESSLETVADTVEPLQGVANGVGRVTRRLSPSS